MTKLFYLLSLSIFGCASQSPITRQPSSVGDAEYQQAIREWLPEGRYEGSTEDGTQKCSVSAQYGMNFTITGNTADFVFDRDRGSELCMYNQACFTLAELSPEVRNYESAGDHLSVTIVSRGGESGRKSKMTIGIERGQGGQKVVTIEEGVGIGHLFTTRVTCVLQR